MSSEDQLTICIIENYLDFKLGEVFEEISNELKMEGIQPIPPDQEALETILRAAEDRVQTVNMNQQLMAHTFKQQEYIQEKEFYYEVPINNPDNNNNKRKKESVFFFLLLFYLFLLSLLTCTWRYLDGRAHFQLVSFRLSHFRIFCLYIYIYTLFICVPHFSI